MPEPPSPEDAGPRDLSVVLATEDVESVAGVLAALRRQTRPERLELVLVSLSGAPLEVDPADLDRLGGHQVVRPEAPVTLAAGRALGVLAARGRFVHIGETHAFPQPDWAERLIESLDERWSAVVSGIENANPDGAISWANLLIDYGSWLAHVPCGEIGAPPPYNTAFERSFARRAVERSPEAFAPGYDLQALFRAGGHRILFQPAARVDHVNVSLASHWLRQRFVAARFQAALRSRDWSRSRRLAYAAAAPLIPVVLAARLAAAVIATRRARELPRLTIPAIAVGLVAKALGEATAFVGGASESTAQRADAYELHKTRFAAAR